MGLFGWSRRLLLSGRMYSQSSLRGEARVLKIDNDQSIRIKLFGNGDHAVLLLPGALGSGESDMSPIVSSGKRDADWTLIAFDPPGFGGSRPRERVWPLNFYRSDAEVAIKAMKELGYGEFSIMGWSDGGISALISAASTDVYEFSIKKCVVWGSSAFYTEEDIRRIEAIRDVSVWSPRLREPMENMYGIEGFPKLWNEWCDACVRIYKENNGNLCRELLPKISCPTLILNGDKDPVVDPIHADILHREIKRSVLHRFPDGKHNIHFKYRDDFNRLVQEFILDK